MKSKHIIYQDLRKVSFSVEENILIFKRETTQTFPVYDTPETLTNLNSSHWIDACSIDLTIQLSQNTQIQIGNLSTRKASTPFNIYNFSHEHISKNSVKTQLLKLRFIFQGCLFEHIFAFENSCWNMKYIFAFSIWFLNLVFPIKLFIIIFQKN